MRFHRGPPKRCHAWTSDDLQSHNINVVDTDCATFFGTSELPIPSVSEAILTTAVQRSCADALPALDDPDRLFFTLLHEAIRPQTLLSSSTNSSPVINFIYHLLNILGYNGVDGDRIIRRYQDMPLFMSGRNTYATAEACVFHPTSETVLLLVKEDRRSPEHRLSSGQKCGKGGLQEEHPEAQLLAQAIAVFQVHNRALRLMRLPPVETKIVPAMVMCGTTPVLYKFEITAGLVEAVQTSQYPSKATKVQRLMPPVARPESLMDEGICPVDNRRVLLSCLEAFKEIVWMESTFSSRM